jgi:hypothetical protein
MRPARRFTVPAMILLLLACQSPAQSNEVKIKISQRSSDSAVFTRPTIRPYFIGYWSPADTGYKAFTTATGGVGVAIEAPRFLVDVRAMADSGRKQDSGTGHSLYLRGSAFYKFQNGWYIGGGARWSKLITDIYSKEAWRPQAGVGKDWIKPNFSARGQALYVFPGTDRLNAVQGPEFSLWLPSPATKRHWFFHQTLGIYEYHQTSVPGNSGTQNRSGALFGGWGVVYRF